MALPTEFGRKPLRRGGAEAKATSPLSTGSWERLSGRSDTLTSPESCDVIGGGLGRSGGADANPSLETKVEMIGGGVGRSGGADANPSLETKVEMDARFILGDVDAEEPQLPREMLPAGLSDDDVTSTPEKVKGTSSSSADERLRARDRVLHVLRS